ncbi:hypothetical protein D3C71_1775020 [compost metagenome]
MVSSLQGCATPSQPSPPVIAQKPKPTPLAREIQEIDPAPSTAFLAKQESYLLDLQNFRRKLAASSHVETVK